MKIPHGLTAKDFIDWVNKNFTDEQVITWGSMMTNVTETRRARVLLAEVLLRLEKIENKHV